MVYIEFIGPPGAGKSTLYSKLLRRDDFYGGIKKDGITRKHIENQTSHQKIIYSVAPQFLRSMYNRTYLECEYRKKAFIRYMNRNPEFTEVLSMVLQSENQSQKLLKRMINVVEDYQIGIDTVREHEHLCIDEGFMMNLTSAFWRMNDDKISLDQIFSVIPIPDVLIYVTARPQVCLSRQINRERIAVSEDWVNKSNLASQKEIMNICDNIVTKIDDTIIIKIDNTSDLETSWQELLKGLGDLIKQK